MYTHVHYGTVVIVFATSTHHTYNNRQSLPLSNQWFSIDKYSHMEKVEGEEEGEGRREDISVPEAILINAQPHQSDKQLTIYHPLAMGKVKAKY